MLLSGVITEQLFCLVIFLTTLDLQKFLFNITVLTMLLTTGWSLSVTPYQVHISLIACASFWMRFRNKSERLMSLKCHTAQPPLEKLSTGNRKGGFPLARSAEHF